MLDRFSGPPRACRTMIAFRHSLLVVIGVLLAACAAAPGGRDEANREDRNYHLLMAEIALQRGEYATGVEEYLRAAEASDSVETARQATMVAFDYGYDRIAYRSAKRWLVLDPDDTQALTYGGRLALRHQEVEPALKHFRRVVDASTDREESFREILAVLMNDGHPDDALGIARELAVGFPESPYSAAMAASVAMRAGESALAVEYANRAIELNPDEPGAVLLLARALREDGDEEGALTVSAPLADADDIELRLDYALFLATSDRPDEARTIVNRVLQDEPENADAWRSMALIGLQQGDYDAAWSDFSDLLRSGEYSHEAIFYLASIAEEREDYFQAMRLYSQVGEGPYEVGAQQRVSVILTRLGQAGAALANLQRFARREPRQALDVRLVEAQLLEAMERYDEALAAYEEVLAAKPPTLGILLSRAELQLGRGETELAIRDYREALALRPDNATAQNALGYTLADRTDRLKEARRLIERALAQEPDNPAIVDSMGWVLFRQGKPDEALPYLERAWEMIRDPEVAAHLGETLWTLGERDRAREILEEAYDEYPQSEPLQETLKRLMTDAEGDRS